MHGDSFSRSFFEREDEKLILTGFFTSNIMELSFQKIVYFYSGISALIGFFCTQKSVIDYPVSRFNF